MIANTAKQGYDHNKGAAPLLRSSYWFSVPFLVINMALLACACVFWRRISTGQWVDFSLDAYYRDLGRPLGETLLHPISTLSHPWMIPVTGLVLAAIIFLPAITAVLYRLVFALAFAVVVAVLGHAPVLSAALAAGCIMAAFTPLRSDMPFCAAMLAVVPVVLYLYLFGFSDYQAAELLPLRRWVIAGPMLVAMVAVILASSASLALAKLTKFRSGVVWPLGLVMIAGSAWIFQARVGQDELDYLLIVQHLGSGDVVFQPVSVDRWIERQGAHGLGRDLLGNRLKDHLKDRQLQLAGRCEEFLVKHPHSDRAAEILWLHAQCRSLELDEYSLEAGLVRYSASFVQATSLDSYQKLVEDFPGSAQAALARWRLGELALRSGQADKADLLLQSSAARLGASLVTEDPRSADQRKDGMFRQRLSIPPQAYYTEALFRVQRLIWLMERNKILTGSAAARALSAMLSISPHKPQYLEALGSLLDQYENTALGDNLKLAVAMATDDPYMQAEMLIWLAVDERTDAAVEANYELGMLVMQSASARALTLMPGIKKPAEYFRIVIAAPPNPWQQFAQRHLARLGSTGAS